MKKLKYKKPIAATLIFLLLFTGCYVFDFVNQPYAADPDSFFEVQISVTYNDPPAYGAESSYFGILLPDGWTINDSIGYINETLNDTSFMIYSDSLVQQMSSIDPPPLNYYWWVGVGSVPGQKTQHSFRNSKYLPIVRPVISFLTICLVMIIMD